MSSVVILLLTISMWGFFVVLLFSMPLVAISALIGYFVGGAWGAIIGFILGIGFFAPKD
jgi:hypothetical protein